MSTAPKGSDDLGFIWEATLRVLGEQQLPLGVYVEYAVLADDKTRDRAEMLLDGGRQTDGTGAVISSLTVGDDDIVLAAHDCQCMSQPRDFQALILADATEVRL
jgi:hypothetical protein